jgi:hypothetical protein
MADVQIAVIDTTENQVNVAVPGVQGPIGSVAIAQDGTAAEPGIRFESDTNTGIYRPGADQLAVSTGGTERMRLDSSGRLGIGTSSPSALLHVNSGGNTVALISSAFSNSVETALQIDTVGDSARANIYFSKSGTNRGAIKFTHNATATSEVLGFNVAGGSDKLAITGSGNVGIGTTSPGSALEINAAAATSPFIAKINTAEAARIDSSGRLLVGTSTSTSAPGWASVYTAQVAANAQIAGTNLEKSSISLQNYQNNAESHPAVTFAKSNSGTTGTFDSALAANAIVGALVFSGDDGTKFVTAGSIAAYIDGTPGADDMPGRLVFSTTADGAATPTERLRITSAGVLQVADAGNITVGTTTGTKIGTATTQKLGFYNATPVVQPTAVADATDAATVITQLNALLTRMRNLGLIAT